jgi:uncharacterized protein (DUF952 family)
MTTAPAARRALHLTPRETWLAWREGPPDAPFVAESLAAEGFIHLTHEPAVLAWVADHFYRDDPRAYVVLGIDLDALTSAWRYDGDERFPHVYGPLDRAAITGVRTYERDPDGAWAGMGGPAA